MTFKDVLSLLLFILGVFVGICIYVIIIFLGTNISLKLKDKIEEKRKDKK